MSDHAEDRLDANEATWDRVARLLLGVALLALGVSGPFPEGVGAALRIASIVPFATAAVGWCPLYEILGVSTRRAHPHP